MSAPEQQLANPAELLHRNGTGWLGSACPQGTGVADSLEASGTAARQDRGAFPGSVVHCHVTVSQAQKADG